MQLLRLRPAFEGADVTFATVRRTYRTEVPDSRFYVIRDCNRWQKGRVVLSMLGIARVLLLVRPDVVISTGAAPGYLALRMARLIGCRTIWVDSVANAEELSLSGRMVRGHADLWLTQWAHLAGPDGPRFEGSVL